VSDRPLVVGDYVVTPYGEGIVEHVGIRSTQLRRLDQALVMIPNNLLNNCEILNWSRLSKRRLDLVLSLRYDTTPDRIEDFLARVREMLHDRPTVEDDSVVVYFINFNASSLDVMVRCYILIADWGEFTAEKEAINLKLMDIAQDAGVGFAYPSTSLYVEQMPTFKMDTPPIRESRPESPKTSTGTYKPVAPHGDEPDK
jgi:MscS family membrane protein